MLRTLRRRFILSHILPLLIVFPFVGVATIYVVEQQILVPSLLAELKGNALVLSRLAAQEQEIWTEPGYTTRLLTQGAFYENGRLMLLDSRQVLLASSEPSDADRIGTQVDLPSADAARRGQVVGQLIYSSALQDDIADAIAAVIGDTGEILGFVRLSYHRASLTDQIYQMRYLLGGILAVGLLLGTFIGIVLAVNVSNPITKTTQAVNDYASGVENVVLPETGAEETQNLAHSVNLLIKRLEGMETARKRLLANLVHEIGRPLGALRMGIEALSRGADRDPTFYAELLSGMDQETARLQRLLEDLAHLHEQALGSLEIVHEPINLAVWLPETLISWQQIALKKHLHWELLMPDDLPMIQADALRLSQVVGNLVSNAIKFTPPGGSILIETVQADSQVGIRIHDNGPGIASDLHEKIFAPFMRGGSGSRFPQGMGLGLSIARELVEAHGGRLELESQPGYGATFTAWLPVS